MSTAAGAGGAAFPFIRSPDQRAIWYERPGPAAEVLNVGELPNPEPGRGEVRVRVALSGINPTDVLELESARGRCLVRRFV